MNESVKSREADIQAVYMDPHQQRVFQMFVALGQERSLPKLHAACQANNLNISEGTLKRWSSKFKWFDLVLRTDAAISNRIAEEALPLHVAAVQQDLDYIQKLKEVFYARVDAGEIRVELSDYVVLLKTQALLVGDPTQRTEHVDRTEHQVTVVMTDDQLELMMRADAARKHNLPMPEPVTHDNDE